MAKRGAPLRMNENIRTGHVFEVLCEVRFAGLSAIPAGAILPGFLFTQLQLEGMISKIEAQPQVAIPLAMREKDTNLRYLATHRMTGDAGLLVAVGDHSLSVSVVDAYAGWPDLQTKAKVVFSKALEVGAIGDIERVSVKYLNLFRADLGGDQSCLINAAFRVGSRTITSEPLTVRTEFKIGSVTTVVQITAQATLNSTLASVTGGTGLVADLDFIVIKPHSGIEEIMKSLNDAHEIALEFYNDLTAVQGEAK